MQQEMQSGLGSFAMLIFALDVVHADIVITCLLQLKFFTPLLLEKRMMSMCGELTCGVSFIILK